MVSKLAFGMAALAVVSILALIADFYRRFHYGTSVPIGIAGIGVFAVVSALVIVRTGRDSQH